MKHLPKTLLIILPTLLIGPLTSPAVAQQLTGLEIYTRTDAPGGWTGSAVNDGGWTQQGKGSTAFITVPPGGSLYFAFENEHVEDNKKEFNVTFDASEDDIAFLSIGEVKGYTTESTNSTSDANAWHHKPRSLSIINVNAVFNPQPEWEMVEIKSSSIHPRQVRVECSSSTCSKRQRSTGDNAIPYSRIEFNDSMIGAEGLMPSTSRFTQIELYPRNVPIDPGVFQTFDAPPHTGNWLPEVMFNDPNGDPRPGGGIRWTTDGIGLTEGEFHNLSLTMMDTADSSYVMFVFDEDVFQHQEHFIDLRDLPWYEDFETHSPEVGADNWRGWKGWDDDPAFDAPVTDLLQHDGTNSIQIEGDADLVKEFEGADSGTWSFTAWQYIPSDFESGGSGLDRGSWFLLLNTYSDGGPYNWSVGMQIDSIDGVMKVFHGDGNITINVPYETDRWVKLQSIVNLDDDWTRIYYDDHLVTEYSWTGGIFGDGGGTLDIAVVDLYANGSTPVYYDDLSLLPFDDFLLGDVNLDSLVDFLDIEPFVDRLLTGTYQPEADVNQDDVVDFLDIEPFVGLLGE